MNIMKNFLLIILYFTLINAEDTSDIGFRYGILSKTSYDSKNNTILSDSSTIHSGDHLRINIGYYTKTKLRNAYPLRRKIINLYTQ